jgi:hypothetical protein
VTASREVYFNCSIVRVARFPDSNVGHESFLCLYSIANCLTHIYKQIFFLTLINFVMDALIRISTESVSAPTPKYILKNLLTIFTATVFPQEQL